MNGNFTGQQAAGRHRGSILSHCFLHSCNNALVTGIPKIIIGRIVDIRLSCDNYRIGVDSLTKPEIRINCPGRLNPLAQISILRELLHVELRLNQRRILLQDFRLKLRLNISMQRGANLNFRNLSGNNPDELADSQVGDFQRYNYLPIGKAFLELTLKLHHHQGIIA
ncbi:hypothetical protein D3C81_1460790 [compost metagenome]